MIDKNKALEIANLINDVSNGEVLFVGGISQLIRGYKDEIKDIDIIVKNVNDLAKIGPVFNKNKFIDGYHIHFMKIDDVYIDVNVSEDVITNLKSDEYDVYDNIKISTLERDLEWKKRNLTSIENPLAKRSALDYIKNLELLINKNEKYDTEV